MIAIAAGIVVFLFVGASLLCGLLVLLTILRVDGPAPVREKLNGMVERMQEITEQVSRDIDQREAVAEKRRAEKRREGP